MDASHEITITNSLEKLDILSQSCKNEMESWGDYDFSAIEKSESSLDAWDYCFSIAIGIAGCLITTSKQLEKYLNKIHQAASDASGDYTPLQKFLGILLHHKEDDMDVFGNGGFINRAHEAADIGFHRLLWGHDVLHFGEDNPFKLMFDQKGVLGILQALRHLIADTMSKQGLPLPGAAIFDHVNDKQKLTNYLIDIAKKLSDASTGNKRNAQTIFSHMFTIRAQDILGGGVIAGFSAMYFKVRSITDAVRKVQFRLIAYSVTFFGQALIGAKRQAGIPYINIPLAVAVFKNLGQLYYYSIKETRQLHDKTYEMIAEGDEIIDQVLETGKWLVSYDNPELYLEEFEKGQKNTDSMIEVFEGRYQ